VKTSEGAMRHLMAPFHELTLSEAGVQGDCLERAIPTVALPLRNA
jgi:hypothetical protein